MLMNGVTSKLLISKDTAISYMGQSTMLLLNVASYQKGCLDIKCPHEVRVWLQGRPVRALGDA